jgi:hypothetical protein
VDLPPIRTPKLRAATSSQPVSRRRTFAITSRSTTPAHAFMRDVGARWDPQAADEAFAEAIAMFRSELG